MGLYYSGTDYIDALIGGYNWTGRIGSGATIDYGFGTDPASGATRSLSVQTDIFGVDSTFESAVSEATGIWSQYANVRFNEVMPTVSRPTDPSLLFGLTYSALDSAEGITYTTLPGNGQQISTADVIIGPDNGGVELQQGQYGFFVLLHEIGHALGLKHPFEGSVTLPADEDNLDHSVLSYTDGSYAKRGFGAAPATPAPDDIAALQFLYGANMSTNAGNNHYAINSGEPLHTIWDAGGNDTIDTSGYSGGAIIDLQEGGGHPILVGSTAVWLAYGSNIENATGGSGGDIITGNGLSNVLTGNGGDDSILGGGGADTILGGAGNDTIGAAGSSYINGGSGINFISYENAAAGVSVNLGDLTNGTDSLGDTILNIQGGIYGSLFNDTITASSSGGILVGRDGNDYIQGQSGNDNVNGNIGADTILGAGGDDTLFGGKDGDNISGEGGDDFMNGNIGNDTLIGGTGDDSIYGGKDDDLVYGNDGNDTLSGDLGNDVLYGGEGDDSIVGGAGSDALYAGGGTNILFAGEDGDTLFGGGTGSISILDGGAGDDELVINGGNDTITGGAGVDTFTVLPSMDGTVVITDYVSQVDKFTFGNSMFATVDDALAAISHDYAAETTTITLPGGGVIFLENTPLSIFRDEITIITYNNGDLA